MLQIRQAQLDVLLAARNAAFERSISRIIRQEAHLPPMESTASANTLILTARHFGLTTFDQVSRLAFLCAHYFGGFTGRPPLPPAALRILYARTPDPREKLDRLEQLGKAIGVRDVI